jgi:hypothetical protein
MKKYYDSIPDILNYAIDDLNAIAALVQGYIPMEHSSVENKITSSFVSGLIRDITDNIEATLKKEIEGTER